MSIVTEVSYSGFTVIPVECMGIALELVFGNCILHSDNYGSLFVFMQFCHSPCFAPMES